MTNLYEYSIITSVNYGLNLTPVYPDTTLREFQEHSYKIQPNEKYDLIATVNRTWDEKYNEDFPADTMSIFVLHADTFNLHDWSTIREDYKILIRYDLSLDDLKRLNYNIYYPPTPEMEGIKMYPR